MIRTLDSFALRALLLVLLSAPQYFQVAGFLCEELFGRADEAGGALLLDLVLLDQARFLGLDNLLSRPGTGLRRSASVVSMEIKRRRTA